jgi:signal transduction histidine kinase
LDAKDALYRIAQEAIHNVVKHARASRISLSLTGSSNGLTLEIRDDGRGFDTAADFPGHLGLTSMSERATRAGAEITVQSAPGEGCAITVTLPVEW